MKQIKKFILERLKICSNDDLKTLLTERLKINKDSKLNLDKEYLEIANYICSRSELFSYEYIKRCIEHQAASAEYKRIFEVSEKIYEWVKNNNIISKDQLDVPKIVLGSMNSRRMTMRDIDPSLRKEYKKISISQYNKLGFKDSYIVKNQRNSLEIIDNEICIYNYLNKYFY